MSGEEARELYYNDSFQRLLFTSNDSFSTAPLHYPSQYINCSGSAKAFSLTSTYNTDPRENSLVIPSSNEAGNEEEADNSKKYKQSELEGEMEATVQRKYENFSSKQKLKEEEKERAPRFAFVTKIILKMDTDGENMGRRL